MIAFLRLPIEIKLGILLIVGLPTIIVVVHPHVRVLLKLGEYVLHIVHYHRKIYIKELSLANRYLLSLILTTTHLLSHILQVAQILKAWYLIKHLLLLIVLTPGLPVLPSRLLLLAVLTALGLFLLLCRSPGLLLGTWLLPPLARFFYVLNMLSDINDIFLVKI